MPTHTESSMGTETGCPPISRAWPARDFYTPWGWQPAAAPTPNDDSFVDAVLRDREGPPDDVKAAIADDAKRIVSGARRAAYGAPEDNFARIALFWQAYFENTGRPGAKVTAADISPLMRLMKEARLCETPDHRDSFVDIIGYAMCGYEIQHARTKAAA
jgi:hypothetical protein